MRKQWGKHNEASTTIWDTNWLYILLTHSTANHWVIQKKPQYLLSISELLVRHATNFFVSLIIISSHNVKVIKYSSYGGSSVYILIGNPYLVVATTRHKVQ